MIERARMGDDDFLEPNDGGCWFCHRAGDGMWFDTEFDTNVHEKCLREQVAIGHPEALIMAYLLEEGTNTFTAEHITPTAKIEAMVKGLKSRLEGIPQTEQPELYKSVQESLWLAEYAQQMQGALKYLKEQSAFALNHYKAKENGGQSVGSPEMNLSVARAIDQITRRGLHPPKLRTMRFGKMQTIYVEATKK